MIRKYLPPLLFAAAVFLAAEITYRVYAIGLDSLNPRIMNTKTTILESGLVRAADNTDVYFELLPNLDTFFVGAPLRTNSFGLVDQEYELNKPDDTFRVAVIGSSWSMASGVAPEDAWHAILEERYRESGKQKIEFINFAVELYGIGELEGTLRHKVMQWEPDLVLAGITALTVHFRNDENPEPFVALPKRTPFTESLVLSTVAKLFGYDLYPRVSRPTLERDLQGWRDQFQAGFTAMKAMTDERGIPLAIVWLGATPLERNMRIDTLRILEPLNIPVYEGSRPLIDVDKKLERWGQTRFRQEYQVSRFNNHPNRAGHEIIADVVHAGLLADGLLPVDKNTN